MSIERQELYCHACEHHVQFDIDLSLDGNHVLECPNCSHEHCRVVTNGVITGDRWDQRNGMPSWNIVGATVSAASVSMATLSSAFRTAASGMFIAQSWMNTTSST